MANQIISLPISWKKKIQQLHNRKYRKKFGLTIVEGEKLFFEVYYNRPELINILVLTKDKFYILNKIEEGISTYSVNNSLMEKISLDKTPSGILAVIRNDFLLNFPEKITYPFVILNGISDPGNLGTIIRTSEAFGFNSIVTDEECVEIMNPKVIRAAMGSAFRLKLYEKVKKYEILSFLKKEQITPIALDVNGKENIWNFNLKNKFAIIVGSESHGVSQEFLKISKKFRIPMDGGIESLNAAISCAIAMSIIKQKNE